MPMVNGRWTNKITREKPQSQRNLAFSYLYYVRRLHNKLGALLQKNAHIKHDKATIEAIDQLLKLICTFVDQPEFYNHTHNPI